MIRKIDPRNITYVDVVKPKPEKEDKYFKSFFKVLEKIYMTSLFTLEILVVSALLISLLIGCVKIFFLHDKNAAKQFTEYIVLISNNWKAFMFLAGLLLFRVISFKIANLRNIKGFEFGPNTVSLYDKREK